MKIKERKLILYFLKSLLVNIEDLETNNVSNELLQLLSRKELVEIVYWFNGNFIETALKDKSDAELLSLIGDDANILSFVIYKWKSKMYAIPKLSQEQVSSFLEELQLEAHYLYHKLVLEWDSYDISNYFSILYKRGKTQRAYGIYTADVKKQDKYAVTKLPSLLFDTKEEAEKALISYCK